METNSLHDLKGSISLRAQETGSGFRFFFFDDDNESYFDLNLEKMADSEEFQPYLSPLPGATAAGGLSGQQQHDADGLFRNGSRVLPLQVAETRSSQLVAKFGDQQVHPTEMLLISESSTAPEDEDSAGGVQQKGRQLHRRSEKDQGPDSCPQCMGEKQQQQQPAGTKKTSKVAAKKINNGVMKFLIKFPSERMRSTLVSIMKSSYHLLISLQPRRGHGGLGTGTPQERAGHDMHRTLLTHFSSWLAVITRKKRSGHSKNGSAAGAPPPQRPSDVELDEVDFVRSILEAVDFTVGSRSRGAARGGSGGPSQASASSSGGTGWKAVADAVERHSSNISSAIAHCKMSYGNCTAHDLS